MVARPERRAPRRSALAGGALVSLLTAAALCCLAPGAAAIDFTLADGEVSGRLDTTLTIGASLRAAKRDPDLVGRSNGGRANSVNVDDGNLNFDRGDPTSLIGKVVHELDLGWRNFHAFGRVLYFYDAAIMALEPERTAFTGQAEDIAGRDLELLDAFVAGDFEVGDRPLSLRAGNRVLSWGESTFIPNGINVVNPIDVTRLRVAGAQIRDALQPVPIADLSLSVSDALSLEAFYQFSWEETEPEPAGTYFSTSDFASPGGDRVFLGFGAISDQPPFAGLNPPIGPFVPRARDDRAEGAQFGLALRYYSQLLNDSELALYYVRHHSRLPLVSARSGTLDGLLAGDYAASARYFLEYPEDIDLVGASFNTAIGTSGPALQGEVSYRFGQPLQVDDVELLYAGLSPLDPFLPAPVFGQSQLGSFGFEETIAGFRREDVLQAQMSATQLLGPRLGADQLTVLGEVGATWIPGLPDDDELRFEGPGTFTSGNPAFTAAGVQSETTTDGFADPFSFGYRLLVRADYLGAIGPVNLRPQIAFAHDVEGTTPAPLGTFVEGRKAMTVSLGASYLTSLRGELAYTSFFGGGNFNLLRDRDFVSLSMSYSF